MFVQSAGCCAGSVPMCFPAGEFVTGDLDLLLGVIEGCPFYMDARICRSWNDARLILDVAPGDPEGFSLGPGGGLHFVIGPACARLLTISKLARSIINTGTPPIVCSVSRRAISWYGAIRSTVTTDVVITSLTRRARRLCRDP